MVTLLLMVHTLIAVALLGAISHQSVALLRGPFKHTGSFVARYSGVNQKSFARPIVALYIAQLLVGAVIYPAYRLNVRIPFEELQLGWAVGLFELKEHFAGIGLAALPSYAASWRKSGIADKQTDRRVLTLLLAFIVWWDFLVGHVLNNIRGLG